MENRKRVLGEFVLIVLGVLTALGAEEWVSNRRDAVLAEEYRTRLRAELTEDARALHRRAEFFGTVGSYGRETLRWLETDEPGDERTLLVALLASERWSFTPRASTYLDLTTTGNLELVGDLELRAALSLYHTELVQRAEVWAFPDDYRRLARGIVPLALQDHVRAGCGVSGQTGSNDVVLGDCLLGVISDAEVAKATREMRALLDLERALRRHIAEVEVGAYLYGNQGGLAENVLALLEGDDE